jgi:hypothetical protein
MVTALYKSINSGRRQYRGSIANLNYSLTQFKFKVASLKILNACSVSVLTKKSLFVKVR